MPITMTALDHCMKRTTREAGRVIAVDTMMLNVIWRYLTPRLWFGWGSVTAGLGAEATGDKDYFMTSEFRFEEDS